MAYTNIDDPSAYFQTALWTGNNATGNQITNDGNSDLKPDFIWAKARTSTSYTDNYFIVDSSRGRLKGLVTNDTSAETTTTGNESQQAERDLESFDTDGFTVGIVNSTAALNAGSASNVAWQWKANGGTTSSNTDGNITATVQASTTAGFSIVTYTGNGVQTGKTVGHGLGAVPKMIISKDRNGTSNVPTWRCYHEAIGATKYLQMPQTDAASTFNDWDNTTPTSSVYSVGGSGGYTPTNTNNINYVAYVFAEKQGFSKFGSYIGNGNTNGAFVYTGFKPAWILTKKSSTTGNWVVYDNKRDPFNVADTVLLPNTTNADQTVINFDFVSNGFKCRNSGSENESGTTYIYMAFAENPFVANGIPTTAR